ncbi:MAG: hypothetical protein JWM00_27 [Candidatus Saccharibacteria bacterium]|nr:hypothetical protein [Candidatus Saccharibacteria bacterium]
MATASPELSPTIAQTEKSDYETALLADQYKKWQKLFGVNPYKYDQANPAVPESVDELIHAIEDICTGSGSTASSSIYRFTSGQRDNGDPKFEVMLNEGNFGWGLDTGLLDVTQAKVTNIHYEEHFGVGFKEPFGKYLIEDTFFIDPRTNVPSVHRRMAPLRPGRRYYKSAIKPANALDVAAALDIVKQAKTGREIEGELPTYVEIGFGMDSAAMLGDRKFDSKQYVGVDAVLGQYALESGQPYTQALHAETEMLTARVEDERPGEHIKFSVAEGEHLDMPDESVREVFMSNVLNAPDISIADKRKLLAETSRILEKGGRLVVRVNWHQDDWSPMMMREFLEDNGAFIVKETHPGQSSHILLERQYGTQKTVQAPEGYYLVCMLRSM